ncbi:hypothetical protein [Arthrobacter sp. zg-Y1171]|uniref:hypothetical protein n=1 Tax=Arthrobacter sp. zg-Y1171 TaxID=2964610 RepID=UPI0021065A8C|nr:hypothetical protein [Arthrobacter sp. zg-Y1171]MCQ1996493.1 hypothetical protein [Arthrobacter sp. zg-Y1171]UWX82095.1 hypothetical protein N2L00_01240 [Arthrobacter sp. zg-Y1171]
MSGFPWVTVIIAGSVLLVLAVGFARILRKNSVERTRIASMSPADRAAHDARVAAEQAAREALSEAKIAHRNALREYKQRVSDAEKEHRRESNIVAAELKRAQQQMKAAEATGRKLVQVYRGKDGSAELFEHQIVIKGQTFTLGLDVNATVDSSGNLARTKRATLTRMTAGGMMLGSVGILAGGMLQKKKVHDDRELYLLLEGQSFAALITCNPDQGAVVRRFATNVNNTARNVEAANTAHEEAVREATTNLSHQRSRTNDAIPVIDKKLAAVKADNSHLKETEGKLASLTHPPTHKPELPNSA